MEDALASILIIESSILDVEETLALAPKHE